MKNDHVEERRRFISDAFHTLNQPLTGLHCGLEIALQKPRSEGEYRKRISDGVEHAGKVLELIRALRQLVDAADPGERFGTVSLGIVLAQVKSELEVLAEATGVALNLQTESSAQVKADPGKLVAALGGLIASEMELVERGGELKVSLLPTKKSIMLRISGATKRLQPDGESKIAEIRRSAAVSYLWTINCGVASSSDGLAIMLPAQMGSPAT